MKFVTSSVETHYHKAFNGLDQDTMGEKKTQNGTYEPMRFIRPWRVGGRKPLLVHECVFKIFSFFTSEKHPTQKSRFCRI
jgi:hypothetical protein